MSDEATYIDLVSTNLVPHFVLIVFVFAIVVGIAWRQLNSAIAG